MPIFGTPSQVIDIIVTQRRSNGAFVKKIETKGPRCTWADRGPLRCLLFVEQIVAALKIECGMEIESHGSYGDSGADGLLDFRHALDAKSGAELDGGAAFGDHLFCRLRGLGVGGAADDIHVDVRGRNLRAIHFRIQTRGNIDKGSFEHGNASL